MATLASTPRKQTITLASASAGPFDLDFRLFAHETLVVFVNGVQSTDFTISSSFVDTFDDDATITFGTSLAIADVVDIEPIATLARAEDLLAGASLIDKMNAEEVAQWVALADQQQQINRAIKVIPGSDEGLVVPEPAALAFLRGRADGLGWENGATQAEIIASAAASESIVLNSLAGAMKDSIWENGGFRDQDVFQTWTLTGQPSTTATIQDVTDDLIPSGKYLRITAEAAEVNAIIRQGDAERLMLPPTFPARRRTYRTDMVLRLNTAALGTKFRTNVRHAADVSLTDATIPAPAGAVADTWFSYSYLTTGDYTGGELGNLDLQVVTPGVAGVVVDIAELSVTDITGVQESFIDPVLDFGADNTGVEDAKTKLQAARTEMINTGKGIILPPGDYLVDGTTYNHDKPRIFIADDYQQTGSYAYWAQESQTIKLIAETATTGTEGGKTPLSITLIQRGDNHANGMRIDASNYGAGDGGNTGIYVRTTTGPSAGWLATYHGETRHAGGTSLNQNLENQSYTSAAGTMVGSYNKYGSRRGWARRHPITDGLPEKHPNPKAAVITGVRGQLYSTDPADNPESLPYPNEVGGDGNNAIYDEGAWEEGLVIESGAVRSDGTAINIENPIGLDELGAANKIDRGLRIQAGCDTAAISVALGEKIAWTDDGLLYAYATANNQLMFGFNGNDRFRVDLDSAPSIHLNGLRVVSERQAAIASLTDSTGGTADGTLSAVSGSGDDATINDNFAELNAKLDAILAMNRTHGLITT